MFDQGNATNKYLINWKKTLEKPERNEPEEKQNALVNLAPPPFFS